jgi:23S rRNA pseudoU1915 N3-methylase RlmH
MNSNWISPNTIIGPVATGDFYYPRTEIVDDIWRELSKGNYILIAAPRRVGKTSIMRDLAQNPQEGFIVKFENIQAVLSENEFYETIYKLIISCLSLSKKSKQWFTKYLKSKAITEIDFTTLNIKIEDKAFNYLEEISTIFRKLDDNSETIVLLLDELPEVLHNINKVGKTEEAKAILKQLRTWRQSEFKKLQFVLAGSIGIHYVVKTIEGRTADLNDLQKINCEPLNKSQAIHYIDWATKKATIKYDENLKTYLLEKIQHYYTPYFINLMLDEIDKKGRKENKPNITNQDIENAFNKVVKNNEHFADWKNRLSEYLPKNDFDFLNEILIHIAHHDFITIQTIYDKAVMHGKTNDYMDFINDLEQDGYIVEEIDGNKTYVFISPFLKAFYLRNNPIYHG